MGILSGIFKAFVFWNNVCNTDMFYIYILMVSS